MSRAMCDPALGVDPDDWFSSKSPAYQRAMRACQACPLREPCAQYALDEGIPDGIFGGMTAAERQRQWGPDGPPKDYMTLYNAEVWRLQAIRAEVDVNLGLRQRGLRRGSAA